MDRHIVCYQIPSFEIALARLDDPSLRDRPVAIASSRAPRVSLQEISSETQDDGVYPGMSVEDALRLCPSLRILPPVPSRARVTHQDLLGVMTRFAPVCEPTRPGQFFLDLTGTTRLFGPAADTAARIEREVIQRYRLPGVAGVGSSKLVSGVAAKLVQPAHLCDVRAGSERVFLAPLLVTVLPGLSQASAKSLVALLEDLNLRTLGEIAEIPLPHFALVFGRHARLLHQWANGIDASPVQPPVERPSVETFLALEPDEVDDDRLLGLLYGLLEELCRTLRRQQRICRRLILTLRHSDHLEVTRCVRLATGTYWEVDMYPCLKGLFFSGFKRRVRLRRMALRAEALAPPQEQLSLFDMEPSATQKNARMRRLAVALDHLRGKFGNQAVNWGDTRSSPQPIPPR